jgi:hypothetical protein
LLTGKKLVSNGFELRGNPDFIFHKLVVVPNEPTRGSGPVMYRAEIVFQPSSPSDVLENVRVEFSPTHLPLGASYGDKSFFQLLKASPFMQKVEVEGVVSDPVFERVRKKVRELGK